MIDHDDVRIVLNGFKRGVFVRSTEGDDKPSWAIDLLPYIAALARLLKATEEEPDGGS